MPTPPPNRFGRHPGRGLRPWLLLPKILCVSLYFGSLASATLTWLTSSFTSLPPSDPRRLWLLSLIGHLMIYLVIPSLLGAIVFGIALTLQHPRILLRQRWLQVKLLSLAILIPSAHWFCSTRVDLLRTAPNNTAAHQLTLTLLLTLLGSAWIILLGRLKPRLRQNWSKSCPQQTPNTPNPHNQKSPG